MNRRILLLSVIFMLNFPAYAWKTITPVNNFYPTESINEEDFFSTFSTNLYQKLNDKELDFEAFKYGLKGYLNLKENNQLKNTEYLTIIDMSVSSNNKRFFIINMKTHRLEHKSLVAHGRNSGIEFAKKFSNKISSYQTSLGFYKTAETYIGKHGFSLRLDGLEHSNNNARKRAIVVHQADYAEADFIKKNGRLGRSYGCPSIPKKDYEAIIHKIKNGSCLFVYYPKTSYLNNSNLISTSV